MFHLFGCDGKQNDYFGLYHATHFGVNRASDSGANHATHFGANRATFLC